MKRRWIQLLTAVLYNCHFTGFFSGKISKWDSKGVCVPGLTRGPLRRPGHPSPGADGPVPLEAGGPRKVQGYGVGRAGAHEGRGGGRGRQAVPGLFLILVAGRLRCTLASRSITLTSAFLLT